MLSLDNNRLTKNGHVWDCILNTEFKLDTQTVVVAGLFSLILSIVYISGASNYIPQVFLFSFGYIRSFLGLQPKWIARFKDLFCPELSLTFLFKTHRPFPFCPVTAPSVLIALPISFHLLPACCSFFGLPHSFVYGLLTYPVFVFTALQQY